MSYQVYHTLGIVLRSLDLKEDSQLYYFFTEQFGLIIVSARGIRKMSSKLRPFLQDGMTNFFDIVSGKNGFILTGARPVFDNLSSVIKNRFFLEIIINFLLELEQNHPHQDLFKDLVASFSIFEHHPFFKQKDLADYLIFRELMRLGYIPKDQNYLGDLIKSFEYYCFSKNNKNIEIKIDNYKKQAFKNLAT